MPEAAEVTVATRQLGALATGRALRGLTVTHPRTTRAQPAGELAMFAGRTVRRVDRHGKWILVAFDDLDPRLGIHLRMSGQLLARAPDDEPEDRHVHARLDLGDDVVWFRDPRTFGELRVLGGEAPVASDVLDRRVTGEVLAAHARRRTVGVKAVLLDQLGAVSGVGSYLGDEALHAAGIAPTRPANALDVEEWTSVLTSLRRIVRESAAMGGVTLADEGWVDLRGRPGRYGERLCVHARVDCATCGTPTERAVVGGRSARWCPTCQPT